MTALFQFNAAALDRLSADGFDDRILALGDEIEQEIRETLDKRAPGESYEISWDNGGIVVSLSETQMQSEYGTPDHPFDPAVRTALVSAVESLRQRLVLRE